jgi:class 3 adenylate cyclase/tetratricopeptide (TPR) repeat protein
MGFLDSVRQAAELLRREGRVSLRALRRELDVDDERLADLVAELVEVEQIAVREGDVLVAVTQPSNTEAGAAALQAGAGDTERRDLTVLFCDLVGSTEMSTRLDSEDYGEAIRVYHEAATEVVTRFGGFVAQLLGDGLLVLFGYPEARDDSADQAVRAALDMVRAVDALDRGLAVRVGLHSGPCVIRTIGAGGRRDTLALGETPNIAARVQAVAEPGEVMVSAATQHLVAGWFVIDAAATHAVKGLPEPMVVHRVLRPSAVRTRLEARNVRGLGPLVGRERERATMLDAWASAVRGEGRAVHLGGEAGIGKSRLALVLREHVAAQPHRWLDGACTLYAADTAFHPIIGVVEQSLGFAPGDQPEDRVRLVERGLQAVGLLNDEMLALITSFLTVRHPSWSVLTGLSPEARRRRTIDGLVEWLVASSAREPVVLLVEDLHWCDPSSLEVVGRVVGRVADERILLVTTARPEFVPPWTTADHVRIVTLEPVTEVEAAELVGAVIADAVIDDGVRERIVERADGNPLFLEELSQMVLDETEHATESERAMPAIPSTLQSSLLARLDRLGAAKAFAQVAAVIGRTFSRRMLHLVVVDAEIGLGDDALDDALAELTDARLITRDAGRDDFTFKHALLQDAARHSMLRTTRRHLHRSVVHVLREHDAARVAAQPELVARHAEAAGMVDDAIALYEQAAEQARARSAHEEAMLDLHRALDLLATQPEGTHRDRREMALRQTLVIELFQARGYSDPEAIAALERVQSLARSCDDVRGQAGALIGLAVGAYVSSDLARGAELTEGALALSEPAGAEVHTVAALGTYALILFLQGRYRDALEAAERAVALYEPRYHHELIAVAGDDSGISALATTGWALFQLGYPDQALVRCNEALRVANSFDSQYSVAQAYNWRLALFNDRRDDGIVEEARASLRYSDEQGFPAFSGAATVFLGRALRDLDLMLEGVTALASTGTLMMAPAACGWLADAYSERGRHDEALATVDAGLEIGAATGQVFYDAGLHVTRGAVALADDRQPEAVRRKTAENEFREAIEIARAQESRAFELRAALSLSKLLLADRRRDEARDCLAPIFASFSEGFATPELRDARALLDELGN